MGISLIKFANIISKNESIPSIKILLIRANNIALKQIVKPIHPININVRLEEALIIKLIINALTNNKSNKYITISDIPVNNIYLYR